MASKRFNCYLKLTLGIFSFWFMGYIAVINLKKGPSRRPGSDWFIAARKENVVTEDGVTLYCNNQFLVYDDSFGRLFNVLIDPSKGVGRKGGENITEVLSQEENAEYWTLHRGYFKLNCSYDLDDVKFSNKLKNHLNAYRKAVETRSPISVSSDIWTASPNVFIVTRYEYVNFYHSMTDFYNAYLTSVRLKLPSNSIHVILLDGHPKGSLDDVWKHLFSGYTRAGSITETTLFPDIAWVPMGYLSPLLDHRGPGNPPMLEEFGDFFLRQYGVAERRSSALSPNCAGLNALFIWRRDYVAHPRNPSGHVNRKIANEDQLIDTLRTNFPSNFASVKGFQLDTLTLKEQLELVTRTDVLIGMHGAGLTHGLFLPKRSALIEFYPVYWGAGNVHFKKISEWRGLVYERWINRDSRLEMSNHRTRIPPAVLTSLVRQVLHRLGCTEHPTKRKRSL